MLHLTLGDGDDHRGLFVVAGLDGHELHVGAVTIEHLQLAQLGTVGIDEDEVVDERLQGVNELLTDALRNTIHGEEVLHAFLIKGIAHQDLSAVSDVHRIPGHKVLRLSADGRSIGTSACVWDTGAAQRFFLIHIAHQLLPWTSSTLNCNQNWKTAKITQKKRELSFCPSVI